jgi:hypothetical protein
MKNYSLTHLSDESLRRELSAAVTNENEATAELLAHIAEFDHRKLFLPAAYPSMLAYCRGELRLSENEAKKRIRVARIGRSCPDVFATLADGRVHLSGLVLLATHLKPENASELLAEATHKSMDDIELLLAERYPKLDVPAGVVPVENKGSARTPHALEIGDATTPEVPATVEGSAGTPPVRGRVTPLSAESFAVQFTRTLAADERFRYLQSLLGHQVSGGDIAEVYARAVEALIKHMERARFGACEKPRKAGEEQSSDPRHISAETKRNVWIRDSGQCTYESESGRRCEATGDVQFDHIVEVAKGGESTEGNLRLRCHGHNQHTAEQTFGPDFMARKRKEAAAARGARKAAKVREREERARFWEEISRTVSGAAPTMAGPPA